LVLSLLAAARKDQDSDYLPHRNNGLQQEALMAVAKRIIHRIAVVRMLRRVRLGEGGLALPGQGGKATAWVHGATLRGPVEVPYLVVVVAVEEAIRSVGAGKIEESAGHNMIGAFEILLKSESSYRRENEA